MSELSPTNSGTDAEREVASSPSPRRAVSPAARRALEEAQARRAETDRLVRERPVELKGWRGPEPVRYGDWEVKGIASDF